jgi:pimeloyl-ACP methyl ester carboxylesterase
MSVNSRNPNTIRRRLRTLGIVTAAAAVAVGTLSAPAAAAPASHVKPTVVLVHGAWADSSSWDGVVSRLLHDHYRVDVFPTPLQSLSGDTAALKDYLAAIKGPIVLVGHSYGGAVVTDAATGNRHVKALVYIDAFAPAKGETVMQLPGAQSVLANPDPTQVFDFVPNTLPPTATTELYVKKSVFPGAFANDLSKHAGRILAATQRPVTVGALNQPSTRPAWKTIPSWYEVGTIDKVIPAAQQLAMAKRAGSHIDKVKSSHLPMVSHPGAVRTVIERAARATD